MRKQKIKKKFLYHRDFFFIFYFFANLNSEHVHTSYLEGVWLQHTIYYLWKMWVNIWIFLIPRVYIISWRCLDEEASFDHFDDKRDLKSNKNIMFSKKKISVFFIFSSLIYNLFVLLWYSIFRKVTFICIGRKWKWFLFYISSPAY